MEIKCMPRNSGLPRDTLRRLARALDEIAGDHTEDSLRAVTPSEVVGDNDVAALTRAVLDCTGSVTNVVLSWHYVCAERLATKPVLAKDIVSTIESPIACVLLCVAGQGVMTLASSATKPVAKMQSVRLEQGQCAVYQSDKVYTIENGTATYLHCVCAREGCNACVTVHHPVKFPCPYNFSAELGDVRAYPRNFQPTNEGDCNYRGARWKNVLDHLSFCNVNPRRDKCRENRVERRAKNRVFVRCEECDHEPFTSQNSLVKHKGRHHRTLLSDAQAAEPSSGKNKESQVDVQDEDEDDYSWLLAPQELDLPCDKTQTRKPKLKRRHRNGNTPEASVEQAPLLENFNLCLALPPLRPSDQLEPHSADHTYAVVGLMLEGISRADVRQPRGRMEYNVGEMTFTGVTAILDAFGDIGPDDVFVDVGAGVGNVALQVALESRFSVSLGIEMREELTTRTRRILQSHTHVEPRLAKVVVIAADITREDMADVPQVMRATHVFFHNTVFLEAATQAVEMLCWLPNIRHIALTKQPCTRHRESCSKDFCKLMQLQSTIRVSVSYTDTLVNVYIYTKSETFV